MSRLRVPNFRQPTFYGDQAPAAPSAPTNTFGPPSGQSFGPMPMTSGGVPLTPEQKARLLSDLEYKRAREAAAGTPALTNRPSDMASADTRMALSFADDLVEAAVGSMSLAVHSLREAFRLRDASLYQVAYTHYGIFQTAVGSLECLNRKYADKLKAALNPQIRAVETIRAIIFEDYNKWGSQVGVSRRTIPAIPDVDFKLTKEWFA